MAPGVRRHWRNLPLIIDEAVMWGWVQGYAGISGDGAVVVMAWTVKRKSTGCLREQSMVGSVT